MSLNTLMISKGMEYKDRNRKVRFYFFFLGGGGGVQNENTVKPVSNDHPLWPLLTGGRCTEVTLSFWI